MVARCVTPNGGISDSSCLIESEITSTCSVSTLYATKSVNCSLLRCPPKIYSFRYFYGVKSPELVVIQAQNRCEMEIYRMKQHTMTDASFQHVRVRFARFRIVVQTFPRIGRNVIRVQTGELGLLRRRRCDFVERSFFSRTEAKFEIDFALTDCYERHSRIYEAITKWPELIFCRRICKSYFSQCPCTLDGRTSTKDRRRGLYFR